MRSRRKVLGTLVGLVVALWAVASPAVPARVVEEGRLLQSDGSPVQGSATFVFTIYDAPTGGNALWTETQTLQLNDGFFSAELGAVTTLPLSIFSGGARYVGTKVNGDAEMTPRQSTGSVPYAFVADNVTGDITPTTVSVGGRQVIDSTGRWVGPTLAGSNAFMSAFQQGAVQVTAGGAVVFNFSAAASGFVTIKGSSFTIPTTGTYDIRFSIFEDGDSAPNPTLVQVRVNGTAPPSGIFQFAPPASGVDVPQSGELITQLNAGDTVTVVNTSATAFGIGAHASNASMATATLSIVQMR
jgi:hypothetical protein